MRYLVIANTYGYAYGVEFMLFGVFDTREDAAKWIIEHPVVTLSEPDEEYEGEFFNFFDRYDEERGAAVRPGSIGVRTYREMSKEQFVNRFIHEFDGKPMYIGGYQE